MYAQLLIKYADIYLWLMLLICAFTTLLKKDYGKTQFLSLLVRPNFFTIG